MSNQTGLTTEDRIPKSQLTDSIVNMAIIKYHEAVASEMTIALKVKKMIKTAHCQRANVQHQPGSSSLGSSLN